MCQKLSQKNYGDLKQNLTTYHMSCLIVRIILHVDQADFKQICDHIRNKEQFKYLQDLYFGKLPIEVLSTDFLFYMVKHHLVP